MTERERLRAEDDRRQEQNRINAERERAGEPGAAVAAERKARVAVIDARLASLGGDFELDRPVEAAKARYMASNRVLHELPALLERVVAQDRAEMNAATERRGELGGERARLLAERAKLVDGV